MSTDNYELGEFDRAIQRSLSNPIAHQTQLILAATATFWNLKYHH